MASGYRYKITLIKPPLFIRVGIKFDDLLALGCDGFGDYLPQFKIIFNLQQIPGYVTLKV